MPRAPAHPQAWLSGDSTCRGPSSSWGVLLAGGAVQGAGTVGLARGGRARAMPSPPRGRSWSGWPRWDAPTGRSSGRPAAPQGSQSPPEEQTAARPPPGALSDAPLSWGGESSGGGLVRGREPGAEKERSSQAAAHPATEGRALSRSPASPEQGPSPLVWGLGAPQRTAAVQGQGSSQRGRPLPSPLPGGRGNAGVEASEAPTRLVPAPCPGALGSRPPSREPHGPASLRGQGSGVWSWESTFLYYRVPCYCSSVWHHCN